MPERWLSPGQLTLLERAIQQALNLGMLIQAHRKLGAINGDVEGWTDLVREHIETGSNFLLVLPKHAEEVSKFCKLFELADDCTPRTLKQADFFLLSQYIEPEAFDMVL